jgi:Ca2+-transporting ATPase
MLAASLAAMPLPLLPLQILWMNLITDGMPALAIGMTSVDKAVMRKPPRRPREALITRRNVAAILLIGALMALSTLLIFSANLAEGEAKARTMAFATLVLVQIAAAVSFSTDDSFIRGLLRNRILAATVVGSAILQVAVIQLSLLEPIFKTVALSAIDWAEVAGASLAVFLAVEARKLF